MFKYKYNELLYAEDILKNGFSTKHLNNELRVLAKYYKELGKKPKEREGLLYKICEDKLESYNRVEYFKRINSALNYAKKKENKLIVINKIDVSYEELEFIKQLKLDHTYKKILFTLMVLDKLNKAVQLLKYGKVKDQEHYFGGNDRSYKQLVESSHITINKRKQSIHSMIGELHKQELVEIRSKGFIKLSFLYDIPCGESVGMSITNFCDIGLYYDLYTGGNKVKECDCCGIPIKVTSSTKKYCDECAKEIKKTQWKNASKRYRGKTS